MNKIILKLEKENFSFIKYILFTYFKYDKIYNTFIKNDIFFIPFKKALKPRYIAAITRFLKRKDIKEILVIEEEIKKHFKSDFSIINGKNIYRTIFCDIIAFLAEGRLDEYEIVFLSDNISEIKKQAESCVKKVKSISVLTNKAYLYESMRDYFFEKYGVMINIRTKKDKFKKHNKIYVNAGSVKIFDKSLFKKVVLLDIYNVYEGGYSHIILENTKASKKYTKLLKCSHSAALEEFLESKNDPQKLKIINIKKSC